MTIGRNDLEISTLLPLTNMRPRYSNVPLSALKKNKSANESLFLLLKLIKFHLIFLIES